jgi:hypothetical protein
MYSRKKRFREIVGEKEVEACKHAFTIVFYLRRDWLQSDELRTSERYTDTDYKWIAENRAFIPSDLYNIFGTINRYMCTIRMSNTTDEQKREARIKISKLLKQADKILCKIFKKQTFEFVN